MFLEASNLAKVYGSGHTALTVLSGLDFRYEGNEIVGIYGASGSGKSTFLHIIGGLDRPSGGKVVLEGRDLYLCSEKELAAYRNKTIGFVFQFYHLLPEFSALENVMIPCLIAGFSKKRAHKMAVAALDKTGLYPRRKHRPGELSGGEQQRTAISRAIVMTPRLLLADEPTGNLDRKTGTEVMRTLLDINREEGMGIIMVTHDASLVSEIDRRFELLDGKLQT